MGPFNPILKNQPTWTSLFRPIFTLASKAKLLVSTDRPYKYLHTLTLLVMESFNPNLAKEPTRTSLILAYNDLGLTSKVVSLNGETL